MKKLSLFSALSLALLLPLSAAAQDECSAGQSVNDSVITQLVIDSCCGKTGSKQRKCLNKSAKALKRVGPVISDGVYQAVKTSIDALKANSCSSESPTLTCPDDTSTNVTEASANIEGEACGLQFKDSRIAKLKELLRRLKKARKYLGTTYFNSLKDEIKAYRKAKSCGKGGKDRDNGCSRTVDPRDGAVVGNVWKKSDHAGYVFVTHNGARSGKAIKKNGEVIENLSYTGLGNADGKGLRHHYRMSFCPSFTFLLKLGSTCYTIDTCNRID